MTCKDGRFNTGNPICSNKPQDLHDNAMIIDAFTNSDADFVEDRFGVERKTIAGIEKQADEQVRKVDDKLDGIDQEIADKIIAQGGVEIINNWDQASDENVFSAGFIKHNFTKVSTNINVPSDIDTLNGAINSIQELGGNIYSEYNIVLEEGYRISEAMEIIGANLRNVTITSNTTIKTDPALDSLFIFKFINATSPIIDVLIDAEGRGGVGIDVLNSNILVKPNCGVTNAELSAIRIAGSSTGVIDGTIFTNAVQKRKNDPSLADHHGISVVGSTISAMGADVSGSMYYGLASSQGGDVNFRNGLANNCYRHAVRASQNAKVDAFRVKANDCGSYAIYAWINSTIRANEAEIGNAGEGAIIAYDTSKVYADSSVIDGGCSTFVVRSNSCSSIVLSKAKISNVAPSGGVIVADNTSDINFISSEINVSGLSSNVFYGGSLSRINAQGSKITSLSPLSPFSSIRGSSLFLVSSTIETSSDQKITVSYGGSAYVRQCIFNGEDISISNINIPNFNTINGNGVIFK